MNMKRYLTAFLLVTIMIIPFTGCLGNNGNTTKTDYSEIVENPNISIPGYESLDFTAGKKKQNVDFYNPEENTCYFRISLVLEQSDGKDVVEEKGTDKEILWTSELIKPGEGEKSIKLDKELESGDYPALLKYECFSLKDEAPLNGSNVELTINVR